MIGKIIHEFLPASDILPYLEAVVSVWNTLGRRDNKYKARIKITVHEHGIKSIKTTSSKSAMMKLDQISLV